MAEIERAVQEPSASGAVPAVVEGMSAADTQLIDNRNGDVLLRVLNGGAEATKVTVVTPGEPGGNPIADKEVEIAAGATKYIGPFDPNTYNNSKGRLQVKLSKVTSVKMEIVRAQL